MKRSIKIGFLLVLAVLLISIGYKAYEYRDNWLPYLSGPAPIDDKYEEQRPEEITPEEEITPAEEITPEEEIAPVPLGQVVVLGDSITYRWDMPEEIGAYRTINQGIDGNHTVSMVLRFRDDVLDLHPDRVVILGGINDILNAAQYDVIFLDLHIEQTADNIRLMTRLAKKSSIEPVLCSVLPVAANFRLPPEAINQSVQKLNASIEEIAAQEKVEYLDLWPGMVDPDTQMLKDDYATEDGIHLTPRGYEAMLQAFTEVLD